MISNINAVILALALCSTASAGSIYEPSFVSCPSNSSGLIRTDGGLSSNEAKWISKRDAITEPILKSYLSKQLSNETDVEKIFSSDNEQKPKIAFAVSGGSYRAMLTGAGMLSAFDNRTDNNTGSDKLGGLLQGATYLAGLSGGNWLTTSLAFNDWISVQDIVNQVKNNNGSSLWNITNSILAPFGNEEPMADLLRWATIRTDIEDKENAGFPVSIIDLWGLALSYQFFENGAQGINWSSLQQSDVFANAEMPFIISTADEYNAVETINTTIFEFNPFEFGSWDHNKFANIEYLGTEFDNGTPVNSSLCVNGFDNAGLILGTSAGLFNEVAANIDHLGLTGSTKQILEILVSSWASENGIPAAYPNPFYGLESESNDFSSNITTNGDLFLVDGGEDGETLPFVPLLQKEREIDAIFAFDVDASTSDLWPSGLDMYATFARQAEPIGSQIAFPFVPNATVFVEESLNKKTVFFGCNSTLLSELSHIPPVVVYIPNNEYTFASNTSTFKLAYSDEEKIGMIDNGFAAAYNNNTDSDYATCVSCAVILRSQQRMDITPSEECQKCFDKYCWEPTA
ncbi:related to Lysophospholipase [Hanseniaspora guilliermondii]|uniref:Lysophospholipase n=1 Tax=Hanseniaspora guilliermondii TaxID=56406 RepID=A0A1L0CUU1_9ASCO|nr:related to Lysophospholipase [Hanseniaspora guilliermondii]